MSIPLVILSAGASIGIGAVSAPIIGGALSKTVTGEVVPTRITDLAGYLTASGDEKARGFSGNSQSFEDPSAADGQGQSIGLPSGITAPPTVTAPRLGGPSLPPVSVATTDKKRFLAVASFGGGLALSLIAFMLIRRVLG